MKNNDLKYLALIMIFAALLLIAPYFIRVFQGNPFNVNSESYYQLRLAGSVNSTYYDALQDRHIALNILDSTGLSGVALPKIIALILGLLCVVLGYAILKNHNMNEKNTWAILLLLVASPIFIYTFMDFNSYAVIILLNLLVIYFLTKQNYILSTIAFVITPFIDIYGAVISFLIILLYISATFKSLKNYRWFLIISLVAMIGSAIISISLGYNLFAITPFEKSNIITDVGASIGFSFSSFILSIIGILLLWENGWKNFLTYGAIIVLIILSIFNTFLRIYLNFILVIFAGFAFMYLYKRKWSIAIIKRITILLIICSILFTTLVFVTKNIQSVPNQDYYQAFSLINRQSYPNEKILSSPDNGYMIEYYTNRSAFMDARTSMFENPRLEIYDNISTSRNLERTESYLQAYSIRYILIDNDYRQYLEEKQGLLFLFETSNKFKNIYTSPDVEVWMYTG